MDPSKGDPNGHEHVRRFAPTAARTSVVTRGDKRTGKSHDPDDRPPDTFIEYERFTNHRYRNGVQRVRVTRDEAA